MNATEKKVATGVVATLIIASVFGLAIFASNTALAEAQDDTKKRIQPILSIIQRFASSIQTMLQSIPIWTELGVDTTETVFNPDNIEILVNSNFPLWPLDYQTLLLTHEYLLIAQAASSIDIQAFHQLVQAWFNDPASGMPTTDGNYTKYYLNFALYTNSFYANYTEPMICSEEFAYIGNMLSQGGQRLAEVPASIQAYYSGILECF